MNQKSFEQYKRIYRFFEVILTVALLVGVFAVVWMLYINGLSEKPFTGKGNIMEIGVYALLSLYFLKVYGGFEIGFFTPINAILSQVLAMFIVNFLMTVQIVLTIGSIYPVLSIIKYMFIVWGAQIIASIITVLLFDFIHVRLFPAWDLLLIYENDSVEFFVDKVNTRRDKYVISEKVCISAGMDVIREKICEHTSVIVYDVSSEMRNDIIKFCYGQGTRVYQTPKISDIMIRSANNHHLFDTPLLMSGNIGLSFEQKLIKRFIDILVSLIMLIVASPFMLITALLIKCEDGGPVFFTQRRITLGNREFVIYKFRSMIVDAEKDGIARPAVSDDERITKVGRFIRKTRIDELPQLINVLKGDMSLVGPRPERTEHVTKYCNEIPEFRFRTKVKGGLTGYAQVYGKYNTSAYDKLKLDLMYIENYSLALDFRIIVMTIKVIFMKSSTEGFNQDNQPKA